MNLLPTIMCMSLNVLTHPHPATNPTSPLMLAGEWVPADTRKINFNTLPRIPSAHGIVHDVRDQQGARVNQHNYLVFAERSSGAPTLKVRRP